MACAPAHATPVQLIECNVVFFNGPLPVVVERTYILRRHWVQSDPISVMSTSIWSQAVFDSGTFEVDIFNIDGSAYTERGTDLQLSILDGRDGFRDELLDEALATQGQVNIEGFTVEKFNYSVSS